MNTPKPCITCNNLYADALYKNDPTYSAECKLGHDLGDMNCPDHMPWKEGGCRKKWGNLYRDPQEIAHQKSVAREVLKKHGRHKASPQLLPAFLFLLEMGEVEWEIGDENEVWWRLSR